MKIVLGNLNEMFLFLNDIIGFCIMKSRFGGYLYMKSARILMLYPSIMEIEQKCEMNSFWKNEWKRVKEDISDFKIFIEYIFTDN